MKKVLAMTLLREGANILGLFINAVWFLKNLWLPAYPHHVKFLPPTMETRLTENEKDESKSYERSSYWLGEVPIPHGLLCAHIQRIQSRSMLSEDLLDGQSLRGREIGREREGEGSDGWDGREG